MSSRADDGAAGAARLRSALSDGATLELLLRLQRGKPRTTEQIREIAPAGIDLGAALTALEAAGLIQVGREGLRVEPPAPLISHAVSGELRNAKNRVGALRELLGSLGSGRVEAPHPLSVGEGSVSLHFSVGDVRALWTRVFDGTRAGARVAIPDLGQVQGLLREWLASDAPSAELTTSSLLIGAHGLVRPELRELTADLHASGADIRLAGSVPYWLAVSDGRRAMLSADGGRLPLTGLISTGSLPIVGALTTVFDDWWDQGASYPMTGSAAEQGLALRARGLDDDTAAAILGISSRTLQREFARFMETTGVRSRFELGVWWATNRQRIEQRTGTRQNTRNEVS